MQKLQTNLESLSEWIDRYEEQLFRYAFFRLGNRSDAEDVVQDTFVKVGTSTRSIRNPKAYLFATVASGCVDILRQRKVDMSLNERIASDTLSESGAIEEEEFTRINNLLYHLPEQQSEIIRLHIHGEMKFTEIAEMSNTPVTTIKSRFKSGIERLRQLFNN
ncbi:MAG: RNA polymerase sigma factor [Tidjanibacter sp.]|nr:RNA polymerase sigma factor [Tidjanibacter sp.]